MCSDFGDLTVVLKTRKKSMAELQEVAGQTSYKENMLNMLEAILHYAYCMHVGCGVRCCTIN